MSDVRYLSYEEFVKEVLSVSTRPREVPHCPECKEPGLYLVCSGIWRCHHCYAQFMPDGEVQHLTLTDECSVCKPHSSCPWQCLAARIEDTNKENKALRAKLMG